VRRIAVLVISLLAATLAISSSASATPFQTSVMRVSGPDRTATSLEVSRLGWDAAPHVIVATAQDFPDALGATPLAAALDAPVLLLHGGFLTDAVLTELERLGTRDVTILGGGDVVEGSAEHRLGERGIQTRRIAGANRYETAALVARQAGASPKNQAVVASGEFFADAVSAGSLSGGPDRLPVLLSAMHDVPDASLQALQDLGVAEIMLIGGTGILSPAVEAELIGAGLRVARLAGPDRFATSARVATEAFARLGGADATLVMASGTSFPDSLAAGPLVARIGGVLLLLPPDDLARAPEGIRFVRDRLARLIDPMILGGTAAVNGSVEWQMQAVLGGDPVPTAAFGDAVYRVGDGFQPGTYRTPPSVVGCYWERLRGFSGHPSEIIANDLSVSSMVVTVLPGDYGFRVSGCLISTPDLTPEFPFTPLEPQRGPFEDGTWLVGRQIPPGEWRASGGAGCFWQRLNAFTGEPEAVIASGSSTTVTIESTDLGFRARRCGSWTPVSPPA
jgi:putative cell wall-binding protein